MARTYPEIVPDLRVPIATPGTWKAVAIMLVMTMLTGAAGIIGSHIGLATKDDLATAVKPLATREDVKDMIKAAVAAESDTMKRYVDERTVVPTAAKKRRPRPDVSP